jgi:hypothetical protein
MIELLNTFLSVRSTILGLMLTALLSGVASIASAAVNLDVLIAPPAPRVVVVPPPRVGYVWAPGYWQWNGKHHVWVEGRWLHERHGYHWVPEHWDGRGEHWHFEPRHWVRN